MLTVIFRRSVRCHVTLRLNSFAKPTRYANQQSLILRNLNLTNAIISTVIFKWCLFRKCAFCKNKQLFTHLKMCFFYYISFTTAFEHTSDFHNAIQKRCQWKWQTRDKIPCSYLLTNKNMLCNNLLFNDDRWKS